MDTYFSAKLHLKVMKLSTLIANSKDSKSSLSDINNYRINLQHLQRSVLSRIVAPFMYYLFEIYQSKGFQECTTNWNIDVRRILRLPYQTHKRFFRSVFGPATHSQLFARTVGLYYNMSVSNNYFVKSCV